MIYFHIITLISKIYNIVTNLIHVCISIGFKKYEKAIYLMFVQRFTFKPLTQILEI